MTLLLFFVLCKSISFTRVRMRTRGALQHTHIIDVRSNQCSIRTKLVCYSLRPLWDWKPFQSCFFVGSLPANFPWKTGSLKALSFVGFIQCFLGPPSYEIIMHAFLMKMSWERRGKIVFMATSASELVKWLDDSDRRLCINNGYKKPMKFIWILILIRLISQKKKCL